MIAKVIVPEWRNSSAHESMHWDPDAGSAMLSGRAVDLDDVLETADLAWATARGVEAGIQIGRACVPHLSKAIDAMDGGRAPIRRDVQLIKLFDQPELALDVNDVRRAPGIAVITLDPIDGSDRLARIGMGLVAAARLEPAIEQWGIEFSEDLPPFVVSRAAIQLAASLYGPKVSPGGPRAFIYPSAFTPLLADALVAFGLPTDEAAAVAWDLPLRDTLNATADLCRTGAFYRPHMCAHEYAGIRRTNTAVRSVARQLGLRAPANLDLSGMLSIIRKLERTPRVVALRDALVREQRRLRLTLGQPRSHPWSRLAADQPDPHEVPPDP